MHKLWQAARQEAFESQILANNQDDTRRPYVYIKSRVWFGTETVYTE